jgi:membrane-associated phospholipid phosphatase
MGLALLGMNRPLGLLATLYAFLVVWSRMELNRHFPSDVLVGSIIGIYCGVLVGAAGRNILRHSR